MQNKEKSKLGISILITVLIIGLVSGGTYAYWQWNSNETQKTNVSFTVSGGNVTAPTWVGAGTLSSATMQPIASCNGTDCIKSPVALTYSNQTAFPMDITVKLYITSFSLGRNPGLTQENLTERLSHLHWRFTSTDSNATVATTNIGALTPTATFNTSGDTSFKGLTFATNALTPTGLTSSTPIEIGTLTIRVNASTASTTVNYNFYAWLDSNYEHTNIGSENSDPLQGMNFELKWGILKDGIIGPGTYEQVSTPQQS